MASALKPASSAPPRTSPASPAPKSLCISAWICSVASAAPPSPTSPSPSPTGHTPQADTAADEIPVTYVPFRNAHFLSAAVSWAEVLGAETVVIGAVEQDSSGYPDCRPAYYEAFNELIRRGTKQGTIRVETPLIALRKSAIVALGVELRAPFHVSWSCYAGTELACGVCDSCVLRLRAFEEAGAVDPIPYAANVTPRM